MITRISLLLSISFLPMACQTAKFDKMLDQTADYDGKFRAEGELSKTKGALFGPKRIEAKLVDVYLHPHEMKGGDYFLGGWIRTVVSQSYWYDSQKTFTKSKPKKKRHPRR